jgi:Beta-lactamase
MVPGLVALVARGDQVHVEALGSLSAGGPAVRRDSLFRISSNSKPVTGAATLALVQEGLLDLDEPVARLLPELTAPRVLRRMDGPLDDTVPGRRPITVRDLLTFTFGFGLAVEMFAAVRRGRWWRRPRRCTWQDHRIFGAGGIGRSRPLRRPRGPGRRRSLAAARPGRPAARHPPGRLGNGRWPPLVAHGVPRTVGYLPDDRGPRGHGQHLHPPFPGAGHLPAGIGQRPSGGGVRVRVCGRHRVVITLADGGVIRAPAVGADHQKFFAFALGRGQHPVSWQAYDVAGLQTGSATIRGL